MIEQLLTEHLDTWTQAVETKSAAGRGSSNKLKLHGIAKLRELILELAVRGQLVPQDENDEPASVLLERIAAERERLVKEKKIKKLKKLPEISEVEKSFDLTNGWAWSRLGELALESAAGWSPKCLPTPRQGENWGVLKVSAVTWGCFQPDENKELPSDLGPRENFEVKSGDFLISRANTAELVARAVVVPEAAPKKLLMSDKIIRFIFSKEVFGEYIKLLNNSQLSRKYYLTVAGGTSSSMKNVSREQVRNLLIPLPSLKEQKRIVAKVDELMALCDDLEREQGSSIAAHEVLVENLLAALTNAADKGEFKHAWARVAEHFDILFTTERSVDQLKQTILQLAVMGKLVEQDPADEPAGVLLERIAAEKARLVKEKVYQKTSALDAFDLEVNLPAGWVGVRIGEVCPSIVPNRDKPKRFTGNIPWITLPCFSQDGWFIDESKVELGLSSDEVVQFSARVIPENSVLMSCVGRFGLTAINQMPVVPNQQIHAFVVLKGVSPFYLSMVIKANAEFLDDASSSTTLKYINKKKCESIQFGLPPFKEQARIAEKIDAIFSMCDQLKLDIQKAQKQRLLLATSLTDRVID